MTIESLLSIVYSRCATALKGKVTRRTFGRGIFIRKCTYDNSSRAPSRLYQFILRDGSNCRMRQLGIVTRRTLGRGIFIRKCTYDNSSRAPSRLYQFILLNDFTCRETRLHNADWFNRLIALGSIQRYAVYTARRLTPPRLRM